MIESQLPAKNCSIGPEISVASAGIAIAFLRSAFEVTSAKAQNFSGGFFGALKRSSPA